MSFIETLFNNKTDSFYFPRIRPKILKGAQNGFLRDVDSEEVICIIDCSAKKDGSSGIAFTNNEIIFNTHKDPQVKVRMKDINKIGVGKNAKDGKSLRINYNWELDLTYTEHGTLTALLQSFKDFGSPSKTQTPTDEKTQVIDLASLKELATVSGDIVSKIKKQEISRNFQRDKKEKETIKKKNKIKIQSKVSKVTIYLDQYFKPFMLLMILLIVVHLVYKYRFTILSNDIIDFFPPPESFQVNTTDELEIKKLRRELKDKIRKYQAKTTTKNLGKKIQPTVAPNPTPTSTSSPVVPTVLPTVEVQSEPGFSSDPEKKLNTDSPSDPALQLEDEPRESPELITN